MSVVLFTDRDLGLKFPAILCAAGLIVERHADHFAPDAADATWMREVARRGWVAVTHDARIRYKPNELAAVVTHRLALLVVVGQVPSAVLARSFAATASKILAFVAAHNPPYIAKVYRPAPTELSRNPNASGRIELWYPKA